MATSQPSPCEIARAPYDRLVNTVRRGKVKAVTALLDSDRMVCLDCDDVKELFKVCVTAPNAPALVDVIQERSHKLSGGTANYLGVAFLQACWHGAGPATVNHIAKRLQACSAPELERHVLWATKSRDIRHVVGTAITTADETFVLRILDLSAGQAFLASLEATFEPFFIEQDALHQQRHQWLGQAMAREMDAVVSMAAERCPLVTADVAWVYCAHTRNDASKYADLCARREWLNDQIKVFHQAIQAGNADLVGAMLEEVPALRRSSMDIDVTALMEGALAPNSNALLQCLLDSSATNKGVAQALVHACRHGAAVICINHLWNWIETFDHDDGRRNYALWDAITSATLYQNLVALQVLLPHVRGWRGSQARDLFMDAMCTNNDEFACAVMELPVAEVCLNTLGNRGLGAVAGVDNDEAESYFVTSLARCALQLGMRRVAGCLDKWWPALTRKAAFMQFNSEVSMNAAMWDDLSQQYVRDVTWHRTRDAYLVQRRVLPGLDHLGWHIATYLYVFDAQVELATMW